MRVAASLSNQRTIRAGMKPAHTPTRWSAADFVGGALCLDFANTAYGRWPGGIAERIFDYGDLLSWSVHAGLIDRAEAAALAGAAERRRQAAARVVRQALFLREATHRLLAALAAGAAPAM